MLKNVKIGRRLIIIFLVVVIISSAAGVVGIALLKQSDADYSNLLVNYGFAQGDLGNFGRSYQSHRSSILYAVTAPDDAERAKYIDQIATQDKTMDDALLKIKDAITIENGEQMVADLESTLKSFRDERALVIEQSNGDVGDAELIAMVKEKLAPGATKIAALISEMIEDKTNVGEIKSNEMTNNMSSFILIMISVMGVAVVAAMTLAVITSRGISKPLSEIEVAAIKMSEGNFEVNLEYVAKDEVGVLAESMRNMIKNIKEILIDTTRGLNEISNGNFNVEPQIEYIGIFKQIEAAMVGIITGLSNTMDQIQTASNQVATGSDQVSGGAQSLAQSTTEQASAVQELSASISQIAQQVSSNAENASQANDFASTVGKNVTSSNEQMKKMLDAMEDINSSSSEISKIIKTIEDIAFQTNILALNAAVEAARAGEAGKGFAVVADEVRNLASKSAEAAKQTTSLIDGSVQSVENGSKIAQDAAKSLNEVVEGSKQILDLIAKISVASTEQSSSIEQVNLGIDQISSVVQTNSATSEESAAASEELSSQAALMKSLVARFKLHTSVKAKGMKSDYSNTIDMGDENNSLNDDNSKY